MAEKAKVHRRSKTKRDNRDHTLPTARTFQRVGEAAQLACDKTGMTLSFLIHTAMVEYLTSHGYMNSEA